MISERIYQLRLPAVLVQALEDATAMARRGKSRSPELKRHDSLMAHRRRRKFGQADMVRLLLIEGLERRGWKFRPDTGKLDTEIPDTG